MTTRNPVARAADNLKWRLKNPETKRAANRAYYLANRKKVNAASRQWALDHSELLTQRRVDNPDIWRAYQRKYMASHPQVGRIRAANYKSRRVGSLTAGDWLAILEEFDGRCAYCQRTENIELEHMRPLSRGGKHDKANVVPACRTCNRRKGGMTAFEFLVRPSSPRRKEK